MKKNYQEPVLHVAKLQYRCSLLDSSPASVNSVDGNAGIGYGGGGNGIARGRDYGFDDED